MRLLHQVAHTLLVTVLLAGAGYAYGMTGEQLARKVYDRPNGKDATTILTMTLQDKGHDPRVRKMLVYRLDKKGGETASLIRFLEPTDIEGTGLLTLDRADGDSDQWVYLPAMDRVRRISSSRKGGRFVNSDYFYEDLRDRQVERDEHRIVGHETLSGVPVEVLESVPVDSGNSVYGKRISWVDQTTLLPLRVDYYGKNDAEPNKRLQVLKKEKVQGFWTVTDSVLTDLESGHQTRLTVDWIRYDRRLPSKLFTTQTLEDESAEEDYRP